MPTLSSSIVKHSVATMREVEDALARQVLYGGDLLTNLLEITQVDEGQLLNLLSQLHGLQPAPQGTLPRATAEALRLLPSDVASRHAIYPLDEQPGALVVCVAGPLPEDVESDLGFLLGVRLEQRVAPRARIAQAIARDYGVPIDRRSARIVARLDGEPDPHPSEGPPAIDLPLNFADVPRPPSVPPIAFPPATELPSIPPPSAASDIHEAQTDNVPEVALRELVKQSQPPPPPDFPEEKFEVPSLRVPAGAPSLPSPQAALEEQSPAEANHLDLFGPTSVEPETTIFRASDPPAPPEAKEEATAKPDEPKKGNEENQRTQPSLRVPPLSTEDHHPNVSVQPSVHPPEAAPPEAAPPRAAPANATEAPAAAQPVAPEPKFEEAPDDAPPVSIGPSPSERLANLGRDVERWKAAEPKARRRGPYTAAEAEQDLIDAESRDDVLSAFFDYSAQYFEYTALFAVQGDLAEGRNASGPGATTAEVRGIGVPLDLPGILRSAKQAGAPTLQALAGDGLDRSLSEDLKRPSETAKLAIPVSVRKHCVLILYGCEGNNDVQLDAVGQVLAFSPLVSQALERVILRRKLAVRREVKREIPTGLARLAEARKRERAEQIKDQPSPEVRASALVSALSGDPKKRASQAPAGASTLAPPLAETARPERELLEPVENQVRTQAPAKPVSQRPTAMVPQSVAEELAASFPDPVDAPADVDLAKTQASVASEPPPKSADLTKTQASEPPRKQDLTKTQASEPAPKPNLVSVVKPVAPEPPVIDLAKTQTSGPAQTPDSAEPEAKADLAKTQASEPPQKRAAAKPETDLASTGASDSPRPPADLAKTHASAEAEAKPQSIAPSRTIVIGPSSTERDASPPTITSPTREGREDSGEQEPIPLSVNKRSKATAVLGTLAHTQASAKPTDLKAADTGERRTSTPPQGTPSSVSQLARARREVMAPNSRRVPALLEQEAKADKLPEKPKKSIPRGKTLSLGSVGETEIQETPPTRPSEPPVFPLTRRSGGKMKVAEAVEYEAEHNTDPGIGSQPLPTPSHEEGPEISVSAVDERVSYPDEEFLDEAPLAASSRRMSVAPSALVSRHDSVHLPKVIVNESDTHDLVQDLIAGNEIAFEAIVEDGKRSLGALLAAFPGPIHAEQKPVGSDGPIRASECGPVLKALAAIGQDAVGFVAVRTQDRDPVVRGWATRLLGEMPCGESARNVGRRVTDKDPDVRRAALAAGRMLLSDEASRSELLRTLIQFAGDARQSEDAAHAAIEMLADLREGRAVSPLIDLLNSEYTDIAKSAQWALVVLTRQDFAQDQAGWKKWWAANSSRHRIEWLIDSLLHEVPEIRRAAGDELKSLTKEYFGYYDDLPRAERAKAQARYQEWWESRGKARFR
ncbi:MAG: hypothetical protein H6718_06330 [Polyangiaceae bacterium]|nr:hypothetical protein [Polyangiaceae bacterium]